MYRRMFFIGVIVLTAGLLFSGIGLLPAQDEAVPSNDDLFSDNGSLDSVQGVSPDTNSVLLLARIRALEEKVDRLEKLLAEKQETAEPAEPGEEAEPSEPNKSILKTDETPDRHVTHMPIDLPDDAEGMLIIDNQTMYTRQLIINDVMYSVRPGKWSLWVPLKPVITHLTGFEDPKDWPEEQWQWNGRNYQFTIRIL